MTGAEQDPTVIGMIAAQVMFWGLLLMVWTVIRLQWLDRP